MHVQVHKWSISHTHYPQYTHRGGGGREAYREGVGGEGEYNFNMYMHAVQTPITHILLCWRLRH